MNKIFLILIMLSLVLLSGCFGQKNTYDTEYYKGSDGVKIEFYPDAPPEEAYTNTTISVRVSAHNIGAKDLKEDGEGYFMLNYDEHYLKHIGESESTGFYMIDMMEDDVTLMGRSIYYPSGEERIYPLADFQIRELEGQISAPTTQVMVTACYPYMTLFTEEICLDMNVYSMDVRTQVCNAEDLSLVDQGAPIAIKSVESTFLPHGPDFVRPRFNIHVENVGGGFALNLNVAGSMQDRCSLRSSDKQTESQLSVKGWLSDKPLVCMPENIRLIQGEADIFCQTVDLVKIQPNYVTPLMIQIDYLYTNSISKTIQIRRR